MDNVKRCLSMLLTLCMLLGLIPAAAFATDSSSLFTDVKETDWCYDAIKYVQESGIMNGTGAASFSPNATTTRGQIVAILHRLEGEPAATGETFTDVSEGKYYYDAVAWASANGIVGGYGDGRFGPDNAITREQMAAILYRYAQHKGYDVSATADISSYLDYVLVGGYAKEAMSWAVGSGLISGNNNMLSPKGRATRAHVAVILTRYCTTVAAEPAPENKPEPVPVPPSYSGPDYTPVYYRVTFDANGGMASTSSVNVIAGSAIGTLPTASWEGYAFQGWYTAPSGGTQVTASTAVTGNMTVYAQWTAVESGAETFQVTFDANDGGTGVYQTRVVAKGEKVSAPEAPSRDLYGFTGWYLESAAVTEYDFDTPVTDDLILYAGWGNPNGSNDELYMASNTTETIFSISDIVVANGQVTVTYNTNQTALMSVEFFADEMEIGEWSEENLEANLSRSPIAAVSGYTESYGELATITLPISGDLPQYYLVRATMYDGESLPVEYVTAKYTATYAAFDAMTIDSILARRTVTGDRVINFDDDNTTNFGVLKSSVIVVPNMCQVDDLEDGVATFAARGDNDVSRFYGDNDTEDFYEHEMENLIPDHLFTFPNKSADIGGGRTLSDLQVGDVIYIEGTTWMFKIKEIIVDGNVISFTQDKDATMLDYYDTLKVDFEGVEANVSDPRLRWDVIDVNASGSVTIGPFGLEKEFNNGVTLSGSISGKVTGKVKMVYDVHLFSDNYFEATVNFDTEITGEIKAEVETGSNTENNHEWKNVVFQVDTRKVKLPTPVTGLEIYIKPTAQIDWKITGDVSINWTSKQTSGFKYNSDTGRTDIKKKENTVSIMAKGKAEVKVGPILDIGVELLSGVLSGGVVAEAGAKFTAEAETGWDDVTNHADSKHACGLCISGRADWYAAAFVKCSYKITNSLKGDIVKLQILDFTAPITFNVVPGQFFVSVINSPDSIYGGAVKFGGGECENKSYRTEFLAQDASGNDIDGVQVTVKRQGRNTEESGVTPYVVYLYKGKYNATAKVEGTNVSKMVIVNEDPQTVVLSKSTADTKLEGSVVDTDGSSAISGATVKIRVDDVVVVTTTTDEEGKFSAKVPTGAISVEITKRGYIPFSSTETVHAGDASHFMEQVKMTQGTGMGGLRGVIRDAVTNEPLSNVKLNLYSGWNNPAEPNTALQTLTTNADGKFSVNTHSLFGNVIGLPCGNYTLVATKDDYSKTSYNIIVYPGPTAESPVINETMSPVMNEGNYRIVLTWGETPWDLDSHLVADTDDGGSIHVYFGNRIPYPNYANLDVDDVDGEGPETITITDFENLSNIRYAVHNYSNRYDNPSDAMAKSGAVVRIYQGDRLLRTFNVPTGYDGTEWEVFTLKADGTIVTVNEMSHNDSPYSVLGSVSMYGLREPLKDYELVEAAA